MDRIIRIAAALLTLAPAALTAEPVTPTAELMPADTLWACYVPGSGTVYRIRTADTPQECAKDKHVAFSWETPTPFKAVETYGEQAVVTGPGVEFSSLAECPQGEYVVGGGYFTNDPGAWVFAFDGPQDRGYGKRVWHVMGVTAPHVAPGQTVRLRTYAMCTDVK